MEKKLVLTLLAVLQVFLGGTEGARILDRCTLALEMDELGVPRSDLARWVFIADSASSFRTEVISQPNPDGSKNYGLFQISNRYWCQSLPGIPSKNICNVNCDQLLTDNIKASVDCVLKIKEREGWNPWPALNDFESFGMTSIDDCFDVEADKVSQKAFMLIYKWMLSDEPKLERKNIIAVFIAASYLRIESLLQHCWKYFDDINCFNEVTACIMYIDAKGNPALDIVRSLMLTRIQKFLLTFVATRDFLDVPLKHLVYLLSSDDICVNTEVEILFIIVRWLGHDWKHRQSYVANLIGCIRFNLMPLWYLLCVRRLETHKLIKDLVSLPKVNSIFNEAIAQITSSMYEEKISGISMDYECLTRNAKQRRWIQDEACPYFHLIGCPYTRDINFSQFESYLAILQQQPHDCWAKVKLLDLKNPKKCCMKLHNNDK
ncbi:kelch-like protein 40b isoform X1 [Drosophila innubila]|uniref:kelch-like protein 40b isoform X1 n=1 Tax=Drosophila innubila TaxID=198719 RepID=UPI00148E875F|nr:kelch-like protein 40b isoform X1 [Drosophila innubila]